MAERQIVADNKYQIRALVSGWIADDAIQAVLISGGTGFTAKNYTTEALQPLFDKQVEGFGEIFRMLLLKTLVHRAYNLAQSQEWLIKRLSLRCQARPVHVV